jgi:drug/metabolite transporter (DMT)-like permease
MNLLLMVPWIVRTPGVLRSASSGLQILRGLSTLASVIFFIWSTRTLGLAEATAIIFIAPFFVTALSIPLLQEQVGIRRWSALFAALIGTLVIIRPGESAFQSASILPVIGAFGSALAIIITRRMVGRDSVMTTMLWTAMSGFAVLSLMVAFDFKPLTLRELGWGVYIGIVSTAGQWLLTVSFSFADASQLAPLAYTQILWSTLLGAVVFGNLPSLQTCVGCAIIIVSGLYNAHRERLLGKNNQSLTHQVVP